jgi:hypothetical protein
MNKEFLNNIVNNVYDKYENNPVIFQKFVQHIEQLPEYFENTNTALIEREKRKNKLETGSDLFIQRFLQKHKYYYNSSAELFFEYNQNKFSIIKEDDIQYKILTSVNENKELIDWKHKIKVSILKQIKERDIFSCIPESETIQNVINVLWPVMFDSKDACKYFLTVLGDFVLKKCNYIYFLNPKIRPFIKEINNLACMLFGCQNMFNYFKFKYYDHKFDNSRLISCQQLTNMESVINYFTKTNNIDIFCVAAHYSQRYENADHYLENKCQDNKLKEYAFYLRNNTEASIIDEFCEKNIEPSDECSISWKNLQFLWKQFIESEKIPNVLFASNLKTLLIEKFDYDSEKDVFLDCTSQHLPVVSKFIKFWSENMETSNSDNDELELDEICSLFSHYGKCNVNEKIILDLIKHYYPEINIEDNKYIYQLTCKLWDKRKDIIDSLKKYKTLAPQVDIYSEEIPINEIYQIYCGSKYKFIASKKYFEKFIKEESELFITEDNFIKVKSFDNI